MERVIIYGRLEPNDGTAEIVLSQQCERCEGTGTYANRLLQKFEPCDQCDGSGERLTYAGRDLLRFVAEYAKHPDVERDESELP